MPYRPGDGHAHLAVAYQHHLKGDRAQAVHWAMKAALTVPNGPRRAAGVEVWRWWDQPTDRVLDECRRLLGGRQVDPITLGQLVLF